MNMTTKPQRKRGRKANFDYSKSVDTFFSSPEMEAYYLSKVDYTKGQSLRLVLHDVLKAQMEYENSNYVKAN